MPYRPLKEVLLLTLVIFAVPLRKYWTKFCVIDTKDYDVSAILQWV